MKDDGSKRKLHMRLSKLILVLGVVLMTGKIYADSEPGLIPLVLVAAGITWYLVARARFRAQPLE